MDCVAPNFSDGTVPCSAPTLTSCAAGKGYEGSTTAEATCTDCVGTFSDADDNNACQTYDPTITSCPSGEGYTAGTAVNDNMCTPCLDGYFSDTDDNNACTPYDATITTCGIGYGFTAGSADNDNMCTPCADGTFSDAEDDSACQPCTADSNASPGDIHTCTDLGASRISACDINYFKTDGATEVDSDTCTSCPGNTTNNPSTTHPYYCAGTCKEWSEDTNNICTGNSLLIVNPVPEMIEGGDEATCCTDKMLCSVSRDTSATSGSHCAPSLTERASGVLDTQYFDGTAYCNDHDGSDCNSCCILLTQDGPPKVWQMYKDGTDTRDTTVPQGNEGHYLQDVEYVGKTCRELKDEIELSIYDSFGGIAQSLPNTRQYKSQIEGIHICDDGQGIGVYEDRCKVMNVNQEMVLIDSLTQDIFEHYCREDIICSVPNISGYKFPDGATDQALAGKSLTVVEAEAVAAGLTGDARQGDVNIHPNGFNVTVECSPGYIPSTGSSPTAAVCGATPESCTVIPGTTDEETAEATTCTLTAADASATPAVVGSCAVATGSGTCNYVSHSPPSGPYTVSGCEELTCTRPATPGYDFSGLADGDEDLDGGSFNVTGITCATGYEGTPSATMCTTNGEYTVSQCTPIVCASRTAATAATPVPTGYVVQQERGLDLSQQPSFSISVTCAVGYTGTATATECLTSGEAYGLSGCSENVCTNPIPGGYDVTNAATTVSGLGNLSCATNYTSAAGGPTVVCNPPNFTFGGCLEDGTTCQTVTCDAGEYLKIGTPTGTNTRGIMPNEIDIADGVTSEVVQRNQCCTSSMPTCADWFGNLDVAGKDSLCQTSYQGPGVTSNIDDTWVLYPPSSTQEAHQICCNTTSGQCSGNTDLSENFNCGTNSSLKDNSDTITGSSQIDCCNNNTGQCSGNYGPGNDYVAHDTDISTLGIRCPRGKVPRSLEAGQTAGLDTCCEFTTCGNISCPAGQIKKNNIDTTIITDLNDIDNTCCRGDTCGDWILTNTCSSEEPFYCDYKNGYNNPSQAQCCSSSCSCSQAIVSASDTTPYTCTTVDSQGNPLTITPGSTYTDNKECCCGTSVDITVTGDCPNLIGLCGPGSDFMDTVADEVQSGANPQTGCSDNVCERINERCSCTSDADCTFPNEVCDLVNSYCIVPDSR